MPGHNGRRPISERFWEKVAKGDGCWEWQAFRLKSGYGWFGGAEGTDLTHRVAWRLERGPIPDGMFVLHHCDNRACVRPDHLFLGDHAANMRDMVAKGRGRAGPRQTHCLRGHERKPENMKGGTRQCRICANLLSNARQATARAERRASRTSHGSVV
jgi:hypothetical protein